MTSLVLAAVLVLGQAETVGAQATLFTLVDKKFRIHRKKPTAAVPTMMFPVDYSAAGLPPRRQQPEPPGSAKLIRAQGALITDQEIQGIVDFIAKQGKPSYEVEIHQQLSKPTSSMDEESGIDEDEEIIQQCIEVIRSEQKASVSLLQRRLKIGYGRAARIMDELENRGIVGPSKGAEPRDILIDLDGGGADGLNVETGLAQRTNSSTPVAIRPSRSSAR